MPPLAFLGTFLHTPTIGSVEVLAGHLLIVGEGGTITHLGPADTPQAQAALQQLGPAQHVHRLTPSQFILPGFIDTHCHAPQYAFAGVGTDLPLFDWLQTYTFPCEARFGDKQHASRGASRAPASWEEPLPP